MTSSGRPLRRDARQNRERLLVAALELFGERESEVSLRELAEYVGVGVGTAYRHFPTYDDLIRGAYDLAVDRIAGLAVTLPPGMSAWQRLVWLLEEMTFGVAEAPGLRSVMRQMYRIDPEYAPARPISGRVVALLEEAKADSSVRPDVRASDVALIPFLLGGFAGFPSPNERAMLRRSLVIFLDGLSADGGRSELPPAEQSPVIFHHFVHRPNSRREEAP